MKCPECQTENPETRKFCRECGAKLILLCPQCGSENLPGDKFCGECGHNLSLPSEPFIKDLSFDEKLNSIQRYLPKGLTEKILSQRDKIEGERKHVTVMFCDMEGFTHLVEKLGPEEAYSIMDQVYEVLIHKVHDYEGTVNEMTGDGIMALFGAPIALEDSSQRAIRSSLAIHREMSRLSDYMRQERAGILPLRMRIGIHTGQVVVGTLGNDLRVEFKAVGDTVNLASRMEGLAEPGTTYVTEETFRLTEGFFRFEALGKRDVKGKEKPVNAYRVIGPSAKRTRFDVSAERGLTPFVGRERELELLLEGFERSKGGRGQAFSIVGEAGVGKSRLLYEFRKAVSYEEVTFVEGQCVSYGENTPYLPVVDILKDNFRIVNEDGPEEIQQKLQRGLEQIDVKLDQTLPYLSELFALEKSLDSVRNIDPVIRRRNTFEALKEITLRGSHVRALVMVFEDLHWVDKTSEECIKLLIEHIAGARVFLIFTFRPNYLPPWGGKSYYNQITLNRLSNSESLHMIKSFLDTDEIEEDLTELLLEKVEGIPFFIEEFTRSLIESGAVIRIHGRSCLKSDLASASIPETLHDVLMARVDRLLEGAKEILLVGSVIGREFNWALIQEVTGIPDMELISRLSHLKEAELILERGIFPQVSYIFQHAMTRELLFNSLLVSKRKEYHHAIGKAMETLYSDYIEEYAPVLAYHYEGAEIRDKAIHYLTLAADRAKAIYANEEAMAFYRTAIEQVNQSLREGGEPHEEWRKTATQLYDSLGDVLELTGQHDEARKAYESALVQISVYDPVWQARLHRKTGNVWREQRLYEEALQAYYLAQSALGQEPTEFAPKWWQAWIEIQNDRMWLLYWQAQFRQVAELAEKARPAVEQYGTPALRSRFFQGLGIMAQRRDRYVISEETMAHTRASLEAIRESGNASAIALAQFMLGFNYLWRRDLDEAEKHLHSALKLAEQIGDVVVQSRCLTYLSILYRKRGEKEEVEHYVSRALTVATAGKMLEYISTAKANLAWVSFQEGNLSEAKENGRSALEMWQKEPLVYPFQWTALWPLIGVALAQDQVSEAVDHARALLEPSQQRLPDALTAVLEEAIRTWHIGESKTARTNLNHAMGLAQELGWF